MFEQKEHLHVFCEEASQGMLTNATASICDLKHQPLITLVTWNPWICTHSCRSVLLVPDQCEHDNMNSTDMKAHTFPHAL